MHTLARIYASVVIAAALSTGVGTAIGEDRCDEFKWNVAQERALFATTPQAVTASPGGDLPPVLSVGRLYDLSLGPQAQVHYSPAPGKKSAADGAYGGIARVHIGEAGLYRVSLDVPVWVDLVDDGKLVATDDYTGQQGCSAPHKVVQFDLRSADLLLQFSGAAGTHVHLTITRAPAPH
jgi:hypothetical protein